MINNNKQILSELPNNQSVFRIHYMHIYIINNSIQTEYECTGFPKFPPVPLFLLVLASFICKENLVSK